MASLAAAAGVGGPGSWDTPMPASSTAPSVKVGVAATKDGDGTWVTGTDGAVTPYGSARPHGGVEPVAWSVPVVGIAATSTGGGYWLVGRDGGVFSHGDARFHGSTGNLRLNQPMVGIAADPAGRGYWLVAADGGVFSFGGVPFFGSTGDLRLRQPIVGMAATSTGRGYFLVARDGGIFTFGDARFRGSTGDVVLSHPIVGMATDPDGDGYWMVGSNGEVFPFNATSHGSATDRLPVGDRVVALAAHPGGGYWILTAAGHLFGLGAAGQIPAPPTPDPVLLAAGDIASCASNGDEATAAILAAHAGTVLTLGDNVYDRGTAAEFTNCYGPSWGAHRARTRPSVGNHEYNTNGAAPYFAYFGAAAGDPSKGYYSFDIGRWHVVSLNSNCSHVPCGPGSPQEQWLRADLAASGSRCTVAYWHHPRYSSGVHGSSTAVQAFWQALYDYDADLVLQGHDHHYERFAPMNAVGGLDRTRGIRSFVVGTGGRSHYPVGTPATGSEVRDTATDGVIHLTLHDEGYDWRFLPASGASFTDAGTQACH